MYKLNRPKSNSLKQIVIALVCLLPLFIYLILPSETGKTILILGDSLSSPYGIGPKDSWVALLQQRLNKENYNYRVVNSSIPGDTTVGALKRLPRELKDYKPTLTIIEYGANDAIQGFPIATIRQNLLELIRLAKKANSKVLLLGMRNSSLKYAYEFQMIYPGLAKQEHVNIVPVFLKGVGDNPKLMQKDKLHPVKEAEPILLKNVWPEIKKILGPAAE